MAAPRSLPKHPERVCWGCAKLCRADDLACGNGTVRTPHPIELFGDDYDASSGDDYDASPGDDYDASPGEDDKRPPGEDYDSSPGANCSRPPGAD